MVALSSQTLTTAAVWNCILLLLVRCIWSLLGTWDCKMVLVERKLALRESILSVLLSTWVNRTAGTRKTAHFIRVSVLPRSVLTKLFSCNDCCLKSGKQQVQYMWMCITETTCQAISNSRSIVLSYSVIYESGLALMKTSIWLVI